MHVSRLLLYVYLTDHIKMLSDQKLDVSDLEGSGITVQRGGDGGAFIDTTDREGTQRLTDAQAELQVGTYMHKNPACI